MKKNILSLGGGLALGLVLGFFAANSLGRLVPAANVKDAGAGQPQLRQTGSAPPLDAERANGPLPPGHPATGDSFNGPAGTNGPDAAASNATAQQAMDAADRNARDFDAQMTAAATFYQLASYERAVLYLNRALALKPSDVEALTALGDTKYEMKDFAGAGEAYERALAHAPDNADLHAELGNTYFQRSPPDDDRAIAEYRKALSIDPNHEKALQNLAIAALRKGDRDSARQAVDRLAVANPQNRALATLRSQVQ